MREIEFRGKRKATGKWVSGFILPRCMLEDPDYLDEYWIATGHENECYPIIAETVGQYTGLKDKNGVKIFEGDILGRLFDDYDENTVVAYKNGVLCAKPISKEKYRPLNIFDCGWIEVNSNNPNYDFAVKGNIHDNPKLLKEAEIGNTSKN